MYQIEFDENARLLTLRPSGFWDAATARRYVAEVARTVERLHRRYPRFGILSDNRNFPVQSAEVTQAFAEATQRDGRPHHGRTAVLSISILSTIQSKRVLDFPNLRRFTDEAEARAWLAEDE